MTSGESTGCVSYSYLFCSLFSLSGTNNLEKWALQIIKMYHDILLWNQFQYSLYFKVIGPWPGECQSRVCFCEFSVCTVTQSKIKIITVQWINSRIRLGYDRWLTHKQLRQDLSLCGFSFARYSPKCSTQIYRALYGDAMRKGTNMAAGQ